MDRNKLAHVVFWPEAGIGQIGLFYDVTIENEETGETSIETFVAGQIEIREPYRGSDIAKMMPDGYYIKADNCHVLTMSGKLLVNTVAPFDTSVVTERAEVSFEEKVRRIVERTNHRAAQRQRKLQEENARLREQIRTEMEQDEPVVDDDPDPDPDTAAGPDGEPELTREVGADAT